MVAKAQVAINYSKEKEVRTTTSITEAQAPAQELGEVHTMHITDRTGDTEIKWRKTSHDEVDLARAAFKAAQDKKMLIYKTDHGNKAEQMTFDSDAEKIIATPQYVGG
jgi:hypothetical protein